MPNLYAIILGLFIAGGIATALWGWKIIANARKSLAWPKTPGNIEAAQTASDNDDLLPDIQFSYTVAETHYRKAVAFPSGTTPSPELTQRYLDRYPAGSPVTVYYDPQDPEQATLEPGLAQGDWLIFALGVIAAGLGIVMLFLGL